MLLCYNVTMLHMIVCTFKRQMVSCDVPVERIVVVLTMPFIGRGHLFTLRGRGGGGEGRGGKGRGGEEERRGEGEGRKGGRGGRNMNVYDCY